MKSFTSYNMRDYKFKEQEKRKLHALDFDHWWQFEQIINDCVRIQFDRPVNIFIDIDDKTPNHDEIVHMILNLIVEHLI